MLTTHSILVCGVLHTLTMTVSSWTEFLPDLLFPYQPRSIFAQGREPATCLVPVYRVPRDPHGALSVRPLHDPLFAYQ